VAGAARAAPHFVGKFIIIARVRSLLSVATFRDNNHTSANIHANSAARPSDRLAATWPRLTATWPRLTELEIDDGFK